jgi:hypothetical protein
LPIDLFISHASEDKDSVARPLVRELNQRGWSVWFDETELLLGDSLRHSIDRGLAEARFGLVILSPAFFSKGWPRRELDGLTAREMTESDNLILPVWHEVDRADVAGYSPPLADKLAVRSDAGLAIIADQIERVLVRAGLKPSTSFPNSVSAPSGDSDGSRDAARITLTTQVSLAGEEGWHKAVQGRPGDVAHFLLTTRNVGDVDERDVAARVVLGPHLKLVAGSVRIVNVDGTGAVQPDEDLFANGIGLGVYPPGGGRYVSFATELIGHPGGRPVCTRTSALVCARDLPEHSLLPPTDEPKADIFIAPSPHGVRGPRAMATTVATSSPPPLI